MYEIKDILNTIICGNALSELKQIPNESISMCCTSPPYWGLRDYGTATWVGGDESCDHSKAKEKSRYDYSLASSPIQDGERKGTDAPKWKNVCPNCGAKKIDNQIGLEETPELYVQKLVKVFSEVKRVLKKDGTLWLNLGDTYSSHKDCKSVADTLRVGGKSENANVIEKGKSFSRNTKMLKSQGLKNKDLIGIPWMVAFALRTDGWYLRQDIIWYKRNPMPESVTDRCTKSHEYIFLLTKSAKYYYDNEAIYEKANYDGRKDIIMKGSEKYQNGYFPTDVNTQSIAVKGHVRWKTKMEGTNYGGNGSGLHGHSGYDILDNPYIRNKRSVWDVPTKPFKEAHFATFPEDLIIPMVKAGCPENGIVLDPFMGSGTTGVVAYNLKQNYVGIELNPKYVTMAEKRIKKVVSRGSLRLIT